MMYKNSFVAVLKVGNQILREKGDLVTLPFGTEYSIFMKNKESRTAVVKVEIDGSDVLYGNELIIKPNQEVCLERFIDNLDRGNKFKFIKKTKQIQDYRGDKIDDGIIRIEFRFQKYKPVYIGSSCNHVFNYPSNFNYPFGCRGNSNFSSNIKGVTGNSDISICYSNLTSSNKNTPSEDEGITVKGSASNQTFVNEYIDNLEEQSQVIILRMRGEDNNHVISKPLTIQTKLVCETCGKRNKSSMSYCGNCGTYLRVL